MTAKLPDAIELALDAYADAYHVAMLPNGSISYADGLVAKIKKDELRVAIRAYAHEEAMAAPVHWPWIVCKEHALDLEDGGRPALAYVWPAEFPAFATYDEAHAFHAEDGGLPLGWVCTQIVPQHATLPEAPRPCIRGDGRGWCDMCDAGKPEECRWMRRVVPS